MFANFKAVGKGELSFCAAKQPVLTTALTIVLSLTAANALFNSLASAVGLGFPYNTFLFDPSDIFADFFKVVLSYPGSENIDTVVSFARARLQDYIHNNPYSRSEALAGSQLTHFHLTPLTTLASLASLKAMAIIDPVLVFLCINIALILYFIVAVSRLANGKAEVAMWVALGGLSYPALLMLTRGNVFAGLAGLCIIHALVISLKSGEKFSALLLLAIAANIRPNAAIFILVFFAGCRTYHLRSVITFCLMTALIFGLSSVLVEAAYPSYSIGSFRLALGVYYALYVVGNEGMAYGSSLFGALKMLLGPHAILNMVSSAVGGAIAISGLALNHIGRLNRSEFVFLLTCTYCLATSVFADYHLLAFLGVLSIQSMELRPEEGLKGFNGNASSWAVMIASCLMLSPKNYFFDAAVSYQVVLNPLILLIASAIVIAGALRGASRVETARPITNN